MNVHAGLYMAVYFAYFIAATSMAIYMSYLGSVYYIANDDKIAVFCVWYVAFERFVFIARSAPPTKWYVQELRSHGSYVVYCFLIFGLFASIPWIVRSIVR